jgi:hypothetical protein
MSSNSTATVNLSESRSGKVAAVIILCPTLAAVSVALRLYTRFVLGKKRFWEDYLIVLAIVRAHSTTLASMGKTFYVLTLFIALLDSHVHLYGNL